MWRVKTIFLGYVLPLFILTTIVVLILHIPFEEGLTMILGGIPLASLVGFLSTNDDSIYK